MFTEIEMFEFGAHLSPIPPLDFCLWGWMKSEVYNNKKVKINLDKQQTIFAHELQSALRLTVGLSNIYCEL
jgi:hypothetical protein